MGWKYLYVDAIRRPEALQSLVRDGLAAVESSRDAALQEKVCASTATPFKLCAALDEHGVPVPMDVERAGGPRD